MAASEDLIDFDLIEGQKENIQSLPGGRSAKKLAELYSPSPLHKLATPTPTDTKNVNDCIRAEYEAEVAALAESDDPLDVFDRYVRWTLDAYPSAQATPQSQLHTLLERATKAFISSAQYKNDPRYLKLWMHYIHFFSDSPRETYMFLSRHSIGETLALFYEEYAAWLESVGRWSQAEEVYKLGIEREARPVARLLRKFKEFEERRAQLPEEPIEPSSPALPTVRPALAAKVDPFGAAARPADPQAQRQGSAGSGASRPAKSKLAIFSDADAKAPVLSTKESGPKGWDTIGSLSDRKKENTVEAKPWVGETLKAGGKKPAAAKMSVFRDPSLSQIQNIVVVPSKNQVTVHPQTGKRERIFVDLAVVYPTPEEAGTELSFEEIIAANRGWLDHTWEEDSIDASMIEDPIEEMSHGVSEKLVIHQDAFEGPREARVEKLRIHQDTVEEPCGGRVDKLVIHQDRDEQPRSVGEEKLAIHQDEVLYDENGHLQKPASQPRGGRKKKVMEVNETQIIKAKLDSPSGPKMRKKNTSEPTMTIHTKAATDDIYDIFNAPLKTHNQDDESGDDDYMTDGDYTTDGESTGTTRHIDEEERGADDEDDEASDAKSVSEWSDFSTRRHVPDINGNEQVEDEVSDLMDVREPPASQSHTQEEEEEEEEDWIPENEDLVTPITDSPPRTRTIYVPVPPEDYEPPTRPYRDPVEVANNRLPFMTPITERTEVSLEVDVDDQGPFKTPSRYDGRATMRSSSNYEPFSSPIREIVDEDLPVPKVPETLVARTPASERKPLSAAKPKPHKGPIIKETLCNPVDELIRAEILEKMHPPLSSYQGFFDHRSSRFERGGEIRKYIKASTRAKGNSDRTSQIPEPVVLELPGACSAYTVRRELGAGAFAPVYLVENSAPDGGDENDEDAVVAMGKGAFAVHHRSRMEALKMETPPTPWEFHMMRIAHSRLGPQHRASASLSYAHEMHLYQDEAFLFLPYHPHGTLLDVINFFRAEASGVMDEQLAMFFTIELLRTVEALHGKSIMHGDLKPDNCLLRLDALADGEQSASSLTSQWHADGSGGWSSRGVVLIDFGRGIDMRAFTPQAEFIADWKTTAQDCAEMREGRPWTWQIDYHGLAGTIHTLLFGKYIETTRADAGGALRGGRRYRIKESLKRYWQTELWAACFDMLLNPSAWAEEKEEGGKMPLVRGLKEMREGMEAWLGQNCERGVGLKALVGRVESYVKSRR